MAVNVRSTGGGGGGATSSDVTVTSNKVLTGYTTIMADSDDEVVAGEMPIWAKDLLIERYITFVSSTVFSLTAGNSEENSPYAIWDGTMYISSNLSAWQIWDGSKVTAQLNVADNKYYIYMKGKNNTKVSASESLYDIYQGFYFVSDGLIYGSGNIENLLDSNTVQFGEHPEMGNYCFAGLFEDNSNFVSFISLPATTLSNSCYNLMFAGTGITASPELPAELLTTYCYNYMFADCESLSSIGHIAATSVERGSCYYMFSNCNSLTAIGLDFEFLSIGAEGCDEMFRGCESLLRSPKITVTTVGSYGLYGMFASCYTLEQAGDISIESLGSFGCELMFYHCESLTTMPNLNITALANGEAHCANMFLGCINLVNCKDLVLEKLYYGSYRSMFSGCIALVNPPRIFAKEVAERSLRSMFYECNSLVTMPVLYATNLVYDCYNLMFYNCSALKVSATLVDEYLYPWKVPAIDPAIAEEEFSEDMLAGTGGTFTDNPAANTTYYLAVEPPRKDINITYLANDGSGTTSVVATKSDQAYIIPGSIVTPSGDRQFKCWALCKPIEYVNNTAYILNGDTFDSSTHTLTIGSDQYSLNGTTHLIVQTDITADLIDTTIRYYLGNTVAFQENTILATLWRYPHTISFDANGGSGSMEDIHTTSADDTAVLPANAFTPSSPNKMFVGWLINNEGEIHLPGETVEFLDDAVIYAIWKNKYTISFEAGEGSGTMSPVEVVENSTYSLPACTFTPPASKMFVGWLIGETVHPAGTLLVVTSNFTCVAQWGSGFTISFNNNGGSGTMENIPAAPGSIIKNTVPLTGLVEEIRIDTSITMEEFEEICSTITEWLDLDIPICPVACAVEDDEPINLIGPINLSGTYGAMDMLTSHFICFTTEDLIGYKGWILDSNYPLLTNKTLIDSVEGIPIGYENEALKDIFYVPTYVNGIVLPECTFTAPIGKQFLGWSVNKATPTTSEDIRRPGEKIVATNGDITLYAVWCDNIIELSAAYPVFGDIIYKVGYDSAEDVTWGTLPAFNPIKLLPLGKYTIPVLNGWMIVGENSGQITDVTTAIDPTDTYYYMYLGL